MILSVKNLTAEVIELPELNIDDANVPAFGTRQVFNNEDHDVCPINPMWEIQCCCPLKDLIEEDKLVFIVDGLEATKQQSLNILNPVINFP